MNIYDWLTCAAVVIGVQILPLAEEPSKWVGLVIIGFALLFANWAGRLTERTKRGSMKIK